MRRWAALIVVGLLAGCAPRYAIKPSVPQAPAQRPAQPAAPPARRPAAPPLQSPIPQPAPQPASADQCGAAQLQGLVGRPRTEIPVPLHPNLQRVACTTCPVSDDVNPARLNFFFDADSGLIRQVRCG